LKILPPDAIKNEIDSARAPIPGSLNEVLLLIVNRHLCPELSARRSFDLIPYRARDMSACNLRQLNSSGANPTRTAMDKDLLVGLKLSLLKEVNECRDERLW
jgi:hypothetical protein